MTAEPNATAVVEQIDGVFIHYKPRPPACEHDSQGWREFDDDLGGETVCTKCGMGAMAYTLSLDF